MYKYHFTGFCLLLLAFYIAVFTFVFGPKWDGWLFPVVENLQVELISEENGVMEFRAVADKVRSCQVKTINIAVGASKDGVLRRVHFSIKEAIGQSTQGRHIYSATIVAAPDTNYIRVDTTHKCHELWDTVSSPWGEWFRPGGQE